MRKSNHQHQSQKIFPFELENFIETLKIFIRHNLDCLSLSSSLLIRNRGLGLGTLNISEHLQIKLCIKFVVKLHLFEQFPLISIFSYFQKSIMVFQYICMFFNKILISFLIKILFFQSKNPYFQLQR